MEEQEEYEKMIALKKAYAEIILNTAKEAAARVMASERKALRFQHDLCNTKDEAFRLSLRLKDMIDAKTTRAEVTSLSQERRIEELDAQLNETEGVILDLRAELRKANHHLEEVKNSHKIYKNECTHRVLAIERNPFGEKILAENITEHDICTKKELVINKDEQNSVKCTSLPIEGSEVLSKKSSTAKEQRVKIRRLPRSSVIYSQTKPELSRFLRCQSLKSTTMPEKMSIKENCFEQDEKLMKNFKNDRSACTLRRSLRKRKAKCWDGMKSDECKYNFKSVAKSNQESKVGKLSGLHRIDVFEDTEFINESLGKHEVDVKEASGVSRCNLIIDEDKVLTTGSILGESFGDAASDDKNRVLKYTFSRKRKKKPRLIEDVSSDTQNMVEVACQLISLSGKDMM